MSKISNSEELQARVRALQLQSIEDKKALQDLASEIASNVNPIKIITHGFKEIISSPEVKHGLFNLSIGMSAGYVAKKIIIGKSKNPLQHVAGNLVAMVVSNNVAMHTDRIRSAGLVILRGIFASSSTKD